MVVSVHVHIELARSITGPNLTRFFFLQDDFKIFGFLQLLNMV